MSYPLVSIVNSTQYNAHGKVEYVSALCKDDTYDVTSITTWTAESRGVCLVSRISATIKTPDGDFEAKAYTSSPGTSYSKFAILQIDARTFEMTRRTEAD